MPPCPVCNQENTYGALTCARCLAPLADMTNDKGSTSLPTDTIYLSNEMTLPKPQSTRRTTALAADSVALYIGEQDDPLLVQVTHQAILGRYTPSGSTQPRIDLTPYGAYDKGISRMHAIIRRTDDGLIVEDLASSNGSWLNSQRLQPYIPSPLRSGDHLRLGQIDIEVHFRTAALQQMADPFQGSAS